MQARLVILLGPVKKKFWIGFVLLMLSAWVAAEETENLQAIEEEIREEQLEDLDNERQMNRARVKELEQKMAELLRQLREKEQVQAHQR